MEEYSSLLSRYIESLAPQVAASVSDLIKDLQKNGVSDKEICETIHIDKNTDFTKFNPRKPEKKSTVIEEIDLTSPTSSTASVSLELEPQGPIPSDHSDMELSSSPLQNVKIESSAYEDKQALIEKYTSELTEISSLLANQRQEISDLRLARFSITQKIKNLEHELNRSKNALSKNTAESEKMEEAVNETEDRLESIQKLIESEKLELQQLKSPLKRKLASSPTMKKTSPSSQMFASSAPSFSFSSDGPIIVPSVTLPARNSPPKIIEAKSDESLQTIPQDEEPQELAAKLRDKLLKSKSLKKVAPEELEDGEIEGGKIPSEPPSPPLSRKRMKTRSFSSAKFNQQMYRPMNSFSNAASTVQSTELINLSKTLGIPVDQDTLNRAQLLASIVYQQQQTQQQQLAQAIISINDPAQLTAAATMLSNTGNANAILNSLFSSVKKI